MRYEKNEGVHILPLPFSSLFFPPTHPLSHAPTHPQYRKKQRKRAMLHNILLPTNSPTFLPSIPLLACFEKVVCL